MSWAVDSAYVRQFVQAAVAVVVRLGAIFSRVCPSRFRARHGPAGTAGVARGSVTSVCSALSAYNLKDDKIAQIEIYGG